MICLSLLACGSMKSPKKDTSKSGVAVNGASLTATNCQSMSTHNVTPYSADENAIYGYTACATNDPSTIKLRYNLMTYSYPVCVYPTSGGATYLRAYCFTPNGSSGEVAIQWSGISFNGVLLTEQPNQANFEAALNIGRDNLPAYAGAQIR
jgi:hypothetical protein